jgi:hypothetical protein
MTNVLDCVAIGDSVMATTQNTKHVLWWKPSTGIVRRNNDPRSLGKLYSEHAFRVFAADMFHTPRDADPTPVDLPHAPRGIRTWEDAAGAIWNQIPCSCGHFRTAPCSTEVEARELIGRHLIATGVVPQQRSHS